MVGRVDTGPHTSLFTWRLRALRQPLQLDVWTKHAPPATTCSPGSTRPSTPGWARPSARRTRIPCATASSCPLADGWTGTADCYFDRPEVNDTPDAATRSEYRATVRGWAEVDLTISAPSARIAVIRFLD